MFFLRGPDSKSLSNIFSSFLYDYNTVPLLERDILGNVLHCPLSEPSPILTKDNISRNMIYWQIAEDMLAFPTNFLLLLDTRKWNVLLWLTKYILLSLQDLFHFPAVVTATPLQSLLTAPTDVT